MNRKDVTALSKPTYYLWQTDFVSQDAFQKEKEKYTRMGFRVVAFLDGQPDTNIQDGIKALIKNHIKETNWQ